MALQKIFIKKSSISSKHDNIPLNNCLGTQINNHNMTPSKNINTVIGQKISLTQPDGFKPFTAIYEDAIPITNTEI